MVKHVTGQTIDCGKGCTIRIDYVLNEKTGVVKRHLHWECRGKSGECGENGETSHGGTWDDAPEFIKQCALKHGFNGASAPADNSAKNWALWGLGGAAVLGGLLFAPAITVPAVVLGGAVAR